MNVYPAFHEAQPLAQTSRLIPLSVRVPAGDHPDPFAVLQALCPTLEGAVLLESGRSGRYSYLAWDPLVRVSAKHGVTTVVTADGREERYTGEQPLTVLRRVMELHRAPRLPGLPDFAGGAIGYVSYDMNRTFEPRLPDWAEDDLHLPDLAVMLYMDLIVLDHAAREWICVTHVPAESISPSAWEQAAARLAELAGWLAQFVPPADDKDWEALGKRPLACGAPDRVSFDQSGFEDAVRRVQAYIAQGDVFQVNLSVRQSRPVTSKSGDLYAVLRRLNPSPYMGFLHFPEFQLVSGSPELLVKVKAGEVSTRPIAGTRPRGKSREEDLALARELIENEKERAEHVMLVDLERNDLGRVCRYGTVEVSEFMVIEEYSHVMHIVSHVRGELADGKDAYDAVAAVFPGGTITGAPKIRTMEIIEEMEPVKRGVYTGSIGWFGFQGDVELNIAIRTMVVKDGWAHVQAGAGIVIDSRPDAEYAESLKKAEALWKAWELSEQRAVLNPADHVCAMRTAR